MHKIYFTADLHFGHANIITYQNRPFKDVEEMNTAMVENWNDLVTDKDEIYVLGDIALTSPNKTDEILRQLKGKKYLIRGNHDKRLKDEFLLRHFEWVKDYYMLKVSDKDVEKKVQRIALFHYAMRVWDSCHQGAWHLYGHSHGNLEDLADSKSTDVGVDCWAYKPVSYEQIKERMRKKVFKAVDHHVD